MVDLMSGVNAPLAWAFEMLGWRAMAVDWARHTAQDISCPAFQAKLQGKLERSTFIAAALDCSTKSRAREISHKGAKVCLCR